MVRRILLGLAIFSICSRIEAQKVTFDLLLNGKVVGKDEVTVKKLKQGLQVGSHYGYAVRGFEGRFDNEYRVDENYAWVQAAATNLNSNTHYLATLDKTRTALSITTMQNGEQSSQQLPVRPNLELLPTLDAAGAQLLLFRAVVHPSADNKYNVVVPSFGEPRGSRDGQVGTGDPATATADQLPSSRQSYDAAWTKGSDVHGTLAGKTLTAHSYTLVFGNFRWVFVADVENSLLQMNVSRSQPNYVRTDFKLDASDAAALDSTP